MGIARNHRTDDHGTYKRICSETLLETTEKKRRLRTENNLPYKHQTIPNSSEESLLGKQLRLRFRYQKSTTATAWVEKIWELKESY